MGEGWEVVEDDEDEEEDFDNLDFPCLLRCVMICLEVPVLLLILILDLRLRLGFCDLVHCCRKD